MNGSLQRLARGTHEIAQNRNVGAVSANAPGIYRQTEPLGQVKVYARVVEFG